MLCLCCIMQCCGVDCEGDAAVSTLGRMPPRLEEELDPVTLHNQALFELSRQPAAAIDKLQYLLHVDSFPAETFQNLLFICAQYEVRYRQSQLCGGRRCGGLK